MADDTERERERGGGARTSRNTRYKSRGGPFQVGDPTINNDFSWRPPHLGPLLLASTVHNALNGRERMRVRKEKEKEKGEWRERRALFFRERPRTEVARGGAPSVGGPPVELKLMDKGRRGLAIFIELTFLPSRITRRASLVAACSRAGPRIRLWSSIRPSSPTYFYNELGFNNTTWWDRRFFGSK